MRPDFFNKCDFAELTKSIEAQECKMNHSEYSWWLDWLKKAETKNVWNRMADSFDEWFLTAFQPHQPAVLDEIELPEPTIYPRLQSMQRNANLLKECISNAVGMFAVYKPPRGDKLHIGMLNSTNGDEMGQFIRYEQTKKGKWMPGKGRNTVRPANILHFFSKFNVGHQLPKAAQDVLDGDEPAPPPREELSESE